MAKDEDTEMTEAKDADDKEEKEEEKPKEPPIPPLEASAQRLERFLGGGLDFYTNPVKVVRLWLGTSSGAAGSATADDIKQAAANLINPEGVCATGLKLLATTEQIAVAAAANEARKQNVEGAPPSATVHKVSYLSAASEREVECWLLSLAVRHLWRDSKPAEALDLVQTAIAIVMNHLDSQEGQVTVTISSLYPLLARLYRLRALVLEGMPHDMESVREDMAKAHNLASLRRDVDTQATLINCMLRDLLKASLVEQAEKLLSNSTFPETASNNQLCRHLYYSGRIQALRLDYTTSYSNLSQCLRKAPTNCGVGFRIAIQRLLAVVQLLMGEIPERHVFFGKGTTVELRPYLAITQAVRQGDLTVFNRVVSENSTRLQQDGTFTLISRLAHQVVKAGLRKLHISYSRLTLQDVADRLGLPSAKSAEYVVAKAVRDGVLDATIHHELGYVQSHDLVDVYATKEPAEAFHRRIAYCLTTHNDAVRGMRYPPDAYKKQLEASRGNRRKRGDDKTDEEKAKELEDELDEDY